MKEEYQILLENLRFVHHAKWKVVKIRQEQGKSYKEVCNQIVEKCKFLFNEFNPCHSMISSNEVKTLNTLKTETNFKRVAKIVLVKQREAHASGKLNRSATFSVAMQPPDETQSDEPIQIQVTEDTLVQDDLDFVASTKSTLLESPGTAENVLSSSTSSGNASDASEIDDEAKDEDSKRQDVSAKEVDRQIEEESFFPATPTACKITDSLFNLEDMEEEEEEVKEPSPESAYNRGITKFVKLSMNEMNQVSQEIIDFILSQESNFAIQNLQAVLEIQAERAQKRSRGLTQIVELLNSPSLMLSAKYCLLNGWQGIGRLDTHRKDLPHCLDNIELMPENVKADILSGNAKTIEWLVKEFRSLVHEAKGTIKLPKTARMKESINYRYE